VTNSQRELFPYKEDLFRVNSFITDEDGNSAYCINGAALLMDYVNSKGGAAEVMQVELAFFPADPQYPGTILGNVERIGKASPGMWKGHLVTIIHHDAKSFLADLTSTQVAIPDVEDAVLPPLMFEVDEEWLAGAPRSLRKTKMLRLHLRVGGSSSQQQDRNGEILMHVSSP
jgi:hypothetical protein